MKIGIANDHTGVELKKILIEHLNKQGYEIINYGTDETTSFDYPLAGETLAKAVKNKEVDLGIAICGTGVGISLACNKVKGIRCCVCSEPYSAIMSRRHNNSRLQPRALVGHSTMHPAGEPPAPSPPRQVLRSP